MKRLVAITLVSMLATPALAAEECTEEMSEKLSQELFTFLEENPDAGKNMDQHIETVEKEYGGEPSEAETCDALKKLRALIEADAS